VACMDADLGREQDAEASLATRLEGKPGTAYFVAPFAGWRLPFEQNSHTKGQQTLSCQNIFQSDNQIQNITTCKNDYSLRMDALKLG